MNSLTNCCLVDLIDVTLACEDANSKLVEVVTRGEREFPFPSIPKNESLWFPFPNYRNGFFSFPSRSRIVGLDFFHSLPIPEFAISQVTGLQKLWRFAKCQEFNYWTCSFLAGLRFLYLDIQLSFSADVEKFCRSGLSNKWRRFKLWDSPADFSTQLFIFEYTEKKKCWLYSLQPNYMLFCRRKFIVL